MNIPMWQRKQVRHNGKKVSIARRNAEIAVGKILSSNVIVHHIDYNGLNDLNNNLVICPDQAYHKLIHQRTDALNACGNPDWRMCQYCKRYDSPLNLFISARRYKIYHRKCHNQSKRLN